MRFSNNSLALLVLLGASSRVSYCQAQVCEHLYGGEWVRVRHVPAGNKWHAAIDNLQGSVTYGVESDDSEPWSVNFYSKFSEECGYKEFLFATGDCTKWLVATVDAVRGDYYESEKRPIIASSYSPGSSYEALWYNRETVDADPWISIIDHGAAKGQAMMLYAENEDPFHTSSMSSNGGADVYVRSGCYTSQSPPTAAPTTSPTGTATQYPTDAPTESPTGTATQYPTPAIPIPSWALAFKSLSSNFTKDSDDEITLNYNIGKDRKFDVKYLTNCKDDEAINATFTAANSTTSVVDDASLDELELTLDIVKESIYGSNIWNADSNSLELCVRVELLSSVTGSVVKKLERDIQVELDFENNFQTQADAKFDKISLLSNETDAAVENYIDACTCNNKESFTCNTNSLGVDDWINVCVKSTATEMEIDYLDSLKMVQGDETLNIVSPGEDLVDISISSKSKVPAKNGVHVASVIPNRFFSYDGPSTAEVSGVVYLKLKGSSRRLALELEIADADSSTSSATRTRALQSDQESAFSMEVKLEKNELDVAVDADSNGAAIYAFMSGLIRFATAVGTTVGAFMMW